MLHRSRATGTLELAEAHGRTHRVHVARGLVTAVEIDGDASSLAEVLRRAGAVDDDTLRRSLLRAIASHRLHGEVLIRDFKLSPTLVDTALRRQLLARLSALDQIGDAQVFFRVTVRPPRGALSEDPLRPLEFLSGRARARDRSPHTHGRVAQREVAPRHATGAIDPRQAAARRTLGVDLAADAVAIKRAYRQLVRHYHPDLHPQASEAERRALSERFVAVTAAYQTLNHGSCSERART